MKQQKLYNAGDRLKESIHYSIRPADKDHNWIARYDIDAAEHAFFTVPDEIAAPTQGAPRVPVYFAVDLARKHGHRGVIMIDTELATPVDDDGPFSATEEDAKEKGDRLWRSHLLTTVRNHIDMCAAIRASGGAPRAASHFTARAFRLLKMVDPGELVFQPTVVGTSATSSEPSAELLEMRAMFLEVKRQNQLLEKKLEAQEKVKKDAEIQDKIAAKAAK